MKIQKQKNSWSCLPTSLGMILDENVDNIIIEIGHNGSEIIRPGEPEPYNRRGFHIQELVKICLHRDYALIQFDIDPCFEYDGRITILENDKEYIDQLMKMYDGILLGYMDSRNHAVAWSHLDNCIYDSNGTIYAKGFFQIESFLLIRKFK
jgi:hypothetical protein